MGIGQKFDQINTLANYCHNENLPIHLQNYIIAKRLGVKLEAELPLAPQVTIGKFLNNFKTHSQMKRSSTNMMSNDFNKDP